MVQPTGPVGELRADLVVSTDKTPAQVRKDLEEVAKTTDAEMGKIGKDAGTAFDEGFQKSTKATGRDAMRTVIKDLEHEGLKLKSVQLDADGNVIRSWFSREVVKGERAVQELAASGAFKKIGNAFSDAIGSGFNVSGKSPLVPLLATVVGFIGELVAGAIQIVNGLVAVLATIPNAIGAVILQVGVLFLAFHGLTTAIQGAFAAKNAEELQKALEGLTPSAQQFVKTLLPLRDFFNELSAIAQENFFDRMAVSLQRVVDAVGPILRGGVGQVASALGDVARGILNVLDSPVFTKFLSELIPATVDWLRSFNSAFQDFLIGLADFGSAVMPFFSWLGESLNQALAEFGVWLGNLSVDPAFIQWLEDMKTNLTDGAEALGAIIKFLVQFTDTLNKAGGNEALKDITAQFNEVSKFLATDEGTKAMEGLLHAIQIMAYLFIFLVNDVVLLLFLFEVTAEFLKQLFTVWIPSWFGSFVDFIVAAGHAVADFFTNKIPEFFTFVGTYIKAWGDDLFIWVGTFVLGLVDAIGSAIGWIITKLLEGTAAVAVWIHDRIFDVIDFFKSIPDQIGDAVGNLLGTLYQAGRNLIQGLINGVKSMFGSLGGAMSAAVQIIRDFLPFSPAKEGPLSGKGDPLLAGQKIVERIATGIEMEGPALSSATSSATSNVLVGANAVQMNFYGQTPTQQQAAGIGAAAGNSLADTLAQRNTRLAIRSIGLVSAAG